MTTHRLKKMGACHEAQQWLMASGLSLEDAWLVCPRGDWLLWWAARVGDRRQVVLAACAVSRSVLHLVTAGEQRPRLAIVAAERWARYPTLERAAASSAAADAAAAAASAAAAADAAADAAAAAASAADDAAAWRAERMAALGRSAAIVRRFFPVLP